MGRPAGSKNKPKGCTTISHCLESQVRAQDEDHLELENHNLLSIIIQINAKIRILSNARATKQKITVIYVIVRTRTLGS